MSEGGKALACFRALKDRCARLLSAPTVLSLAVVFSAAVLSAQTALPPAAVWVADHKNLKQLDPVTNQFIRTLGLAHEAEALAVDPKDGALWALSEKRLLKFSAAGQALLDIDLKRLISGLSDPKRLALDPYDGSLWVAGERGIGHLSASGQKLAEASTADEIEAVALDVDQSLWVLTKKQLLRLSVQGGFTANLALKPLINDPKHLVVDGLGGLAWIAAEKELLQFDLANLGKPPLAVPLSGASGDPKPKIETLALHPVTGTLWIAAKDRLLSLDRSAHYLTTTDLAPQNLGEIQAAAFEPVSESLWLGGKKALGRLSASGGFVAKLPADKEIAAIGVGPFFLYPALSLLEPADSGYTNNPRPAMRLGLGASCSGSPCTLVDAYLRSFSLSADLNGSAVGPLFSINNGEARYTPAARLPEGLNTLKATAKDLFGHSSDPLTGRFTVDTVPPQFLSIAPADGTTLSSPQATIQGRVDDPSASVTLQNASGAVLNLGGANFSFAVTLQAGLNSFTFIARDAAGNATSIPYRLSLSTAPVLVPSPINPTVATTISQATAFLYSGSNPVQTGVNPGTIEPRRAAVIRGKVLARDGSPLTGVKITALNHPEFGQTLSRADGLFDLAVNGGGVLTLHYEKAGHLPAQRQIQAPWQDYALAPDVILIPLDGQATTINLVAAIPMQVARGGVVTDSDGTRQATVLFPQGTTATLLKPDGSTQALTTLTVRATEYTVGPDGPKRMPAPLPPASGYTYAVELSVDEALAAGGKKVGGKDVVFNQPVPFYVDNFLNFPVGGIVPVGYYDNDRGVWVPYDNGRVIKILSTAGGLAALDTNGDGAADTPTQLAALGITDAERAQLASLYPAGKSLWRVALTHFSTWDCNWPYGLPDGAGPPGQSSPPPPDRCFDVKNGSVIECQNQTLGETVNIAGTPFSLNYRSSRVPGRKNTVKISLSGATIPTPLKRIDLEIFVAGRNFFYSFPASPNQYYNFTWDGLDAYGRIPQGEQPVSIRLGYVYQAVYQEPAVLARSFAAFSVNPFRANQARQEITLWQTLEGRVGTWDARSQGLGAWTLDVHHAYDPSARTLYLGSGGRRSVENELLTVTRVAGTYYPGGIAVDAAGNLFVADSSNFRVRKVTLEGIISTVAGNGVYGSSGDGGPATAARLEPLGVAVDAAGSLFILDNVSHRVRKVTPDGVINTVAGNGTTGFSGDGGPATAAALSYPSSIAVDSAGNLFISEGNYSNRIRKVGPDGIITTVAGNGNFGYQVSDGVPATKTALSGNSGVAVDTAGTLYIADNWSHRIRRVTPDGIITTVAGSGIGGQYGSGFSGDGGPATVSRMNSPSGVGVDAAGNVWIADSGNHRIRKVTPDGIITTVAGNGIRGFSGDDGPATAASFHEPIHVAADAAGNLYIIDLHNSVVRKLAPVLSGFSGSDIALPSADGSEVYYFNALGRHLRTVNARTGAVKYTFTYNANGYLAQIQDGDGNVTTIERSGDVPTAILSPYGQRTSLQLDANSYLGTITNPVGETTRMSYTADGLLTRFTNPRGHASTMIYDALGRLVRDENPAGGFWALSRTDSERAYEVSLASALGRTSRYRVEHLSTGDEHRVNTGPDGTVSDTLKKTDGTTIATAPEGTVTTTVQGPDPRFGMQSPITKSTSTKLPSGLTATTTAQRTATLSDPNNPLSLASQTDTITVNGKTATNLYTAVSRQNTFTTAAGRQFSFLLDTQGRPLQTQVAGQEAMNYSYDTRGRLSSITQGSGAEARTSTLGYNAQGFTDTLTDPLGQAARLAYDPAGRITRQTLPDGRIIQWSYDANGNVIGLTPPARPPHGFGYTPVDLESQYTPPAVAGVSTPTTQYSYNADKDLTQIMRPDGQSVNLSYDAAGRLSAMAMPHGTLSQSYASTGQLASIVAPGGVTTGYTYDGFLPLAETWGGAVNGTVTRTYNNDLRATSLSINGNAIAFGYDADNLLTQAGGMSLTRSPQHGLITATTLGSTTTAQTYNGFGELSQSQASQGGNALYSYTLTRDPRGHIAQRSETVQGQSDSYSYSYSYDATGRLTAVTKNGVQTASYGYDANGNRVSANGVTASYDDQDRLLSYGSNAYTYTANGELRTKTAGGQTTTYTYDVLGNLTQVSLPNGTNIEYLTDGRNRRVGKKANGSLSQAFLYQDDLRLIAELDGSGNIIARFVYGEKPNVPEYLIKGGSTYRILTDHLGSPRLIVNTATGAVEQRLDYDEFGNVLQDTNPGFQPFGFAGGLYDQHTKLVRFGARDYDADTGRWTTKDPILFLGGDSNLYAYARNNPLRWKDPLGLLLEGWEPEGDAGHFILPGGLPGSKGSPCGSNFKVPEFWFGGACREHDRCYDTCGEQKIVCDVNFCWRASQSCPPGDVTCNVLAQAYCFAVVQFGGSAYRDAQSK